MALPRLFSSWRKLHAFPFVHCPLNAVRFPLPFVGAPVSILSFVPSKMPGSDSLIHTSLHPGLQYLVAPLRIMLFNISFVQCHFSFEFIRLTCAHLKQAEYRPRVMMVMTAHEGQSADPRPNKSKTLKRSSHSCLQLRVVTTH